MGSKIDTQSDEAEKAVRDIRRATRRHFSAEDKVRIVIAGLRGEDSVAELCRKEGINQNLYYRWSKEFLEAGKKRLAGDTAREATSDEVKGCGRRPSAQGTDGRADDGEPPAQKKRAGGWGVRYMGYAVAEKLEIIRLVEQSSLPVRRTLEQLGIPRSTFYGWYDRYRASEAEGLADRLPAPRRVWNKLPAAVTQAVLELALKEPQLSPRELAVSFVDQQQYFVSEASVYRLLKAHDLITSPAFILMKAADTFPSPPPHPISCGRPTLPTCG